MRDKCCDHLDGLIIKLKTAENRLAKYGTGFIVIIKMIDSILICRAGLRFCDIMKQHRKAENRIWSNRFYRMNRMVTDRINMMRIILRSFHHPVKFRQKNTCKPGFISCTNHFRMSGNQ